MTVRIEANSDTKKLFASSECVYAGGSSLQGTREYQQDALNVELRQDRETGESRIISVLCDGMGGLEGGERASRLAVSRMMEESQRSGDRKKAGSRDNVDSCFYTEKSIVLVLSGGQQNLSVSPGSDTVSDQRSYLWK